MAEHLAFLLLGLGAGAIYAVLGLGLVLQFRASGVVNLGYGAMAMFGTFAYTELRANGYLLLPWAGPPNRLRIMDSSGVGPWPAFFVTLAYAGVLALALYALVFRRLQGRPALAKVAASVGVLLYLSSIPSMYLGSYANRVTVDRLLPADPVDLLGTTVPVDRLYLAGATIVVGGVLWGVYRYTDFGLATRGAAESERGAASLGYSTAALGAVNFVVAAVLATSAGILVAPITGLNPTRFTLYVIPALGAALLGRLSSFAVALAAGLALGMIGSWTVKLQLDHSWLPDQGLVEALPFVAIALALLLHGTSLPMRGWLSEGRLPGVGRRSDHPGRYALGVGAVALTGLLTLSSSYRLGLIQSMVSALLSLSLVVLTGYAGQLSLSQLAFAGLGGFFTSILGDAAGVPFPLSMLIAALVATAIGICLGLPALRSRGTHLAVATLAAAVAIDALVFGNASIAGGLEGRQVPSPTLFGVDLGIRGSKASDYPRVAFGAFVLVLVLLVAVGVANLRRSPAGRRFLAVRSNERAAASAGINVAGTKLLAFGLSSFVAGLAGGLIGMQNGVVSAQQFAVFSSVALLAFAYIGGIGRISGAMISGLLVPSGIVYVALDAVLEIGRYITLIGGLALMIATTKREDGLAGILDRMHLAVRARARRAVPRSSEPCADAVDLSPAVPWSGVHAVLEVADLSVTYGSVAAADGVALSVPRGEIVGLIGPNGAGKTTVLDATTGHVAKSGRVLLDGVDVSSASPANLARLGVARTFQSLELFEDLTVQENVQIGLDDQRLRTVADNLVRPTRPGRHRGVDGLLQHFDLRGVADELPTELSHGVRSRVALARAVARRPRLLLLDEPGAGLADADRVRLGVHLRKLADEGVAILVVDHDLDLIMSTCGHIYVLDLGRPLADGSPTEIRGNRDVIEAYIGQESGELVEVAKR